MKKAIAPHTPEHRHLLFIDLLDSNGRRTHLSAYGPQDRGFLRVSGNLAHGTELMPATAADGVALIRWIQEREGMADPAVKITVLQRIALSALRVLELTQENSPHRSPAWVLGGNSSPMLAPMNNLILDLEQIRPVLKPQS